MPLTREQALERAKPYAVTRGQAENIAELILAIQRETAREYRQRIIQGAESLAGIQTEYGKGERNGLWRAAIYGEQMFPDATKETP